jgi:hypothetical protein
MGKVAWSPTLSDVASIPIEAYTEWYVYPRMGAFPDHEVFINCGGFCLRDPGYRLEGLDPTWDRVSAEEHVREERALQQRFWRQLNSLRPESYLAEGDNLIAATRDAALWKPRERWLKQT